MDYVGICYFTEVGRCLCAHAAGGGGNSGVADQKPGLSAGILRLLPAIAPVTGADPSTTSPPGAGGSRTMSFTAALRGSEDPIFAFSAVSGAGAGWGAGGASGGAPSPEVNAGLSVILAAGAVAFLRRRRARA